MYGTPSTLILTRFTKSRSYFFRKYLVLRFIRRFDWHLLSKTLSTFTFELKNPIEFYAIHLPWARPCWFFGYITPLLTSNGAWKRRSYQPCFVIRPCKIGILLSVNSSLTNLGTYSQKHTNQQRKHNYFTRKIMHYM